MAEKEAAKSSMDCLTTISLNMFWNPAKHAEDARHYLKLYFFNLNFSDEASHFGAESPFHSCFCYWGES